MIVDGTHTIAAFETVLDDALADRLRRSALAGPASALLWERIVLACSGGKRIRPRLLLLAHRALGGTAEDALNGTTEDALKAAAAFELLHTALLLHDDVLDGDLVRRGRPNLQGAFVSDALDAGLSPDAATSWGDAAGLLAGDLLISAVHSLLSGVSAPGRSDLHALVDECLFATAAGELTDVGLALGTMPPSIAGITRMMHDKTAAYSFSAPLRAGAVLAGAGAAVETELAEIGAMLGFVYQLRDDLLGVFGSPGMLGKSVDGDLREGKRTLLIAHAEGTSEWGEVQHLFGRRSLDADDADRLRAALVAGGARERTELLLSRRCDETRRRIDAAELPRELMHELDRLARQCAERES